MQEDMLVKLYELPAYSVGQFMNSEVRIKRPLGAEQQVVTAWVKAHFSEAWYSESIVAFGHEPISCFVAYENGQVVGFACYNTTAKGFFGPTGVSASYRGRGIGKALLMEAMLALRNEGFAYAIIGRVGPAKFYETTLGAQVIKGSNPGHYKNLLK